jgi:hypothetical protein
MTSHEPLPLDDLANALADADFAILFGSAVSNRLTEESDLDIAVAFRSRLSWGECDELRARLEKVVHRPVDLVDLNTADPVLKMQVVRYGRPLVVNDSSAYHTFQMYTISQYLDLKILRRSVEEAMIQRRTA